MAFKKLTLKSKQLLDEMLAAENPSAMLSKHFDDISSKEDAKTLVSVLTGQSGPVREICSAKIKFRLNINFFEAGCK